MVALFIFGFGCGSVIWLVSLLVQVLLPAVVDFFIYDITDNGELHVRTEKVSAPHSLGTITSGLRCTFGVQPCRRKFAANQVLPARKVSAAGTTLSMPCMPHAMLAQVPFLQVAFDAYLDCGGRHMVQNIW